MRSHAFQALRPIRATLPIPSPSNSLRAAANVQRPSIRAASSSSYTPRARTTPSTARTAASTTKSTPSTAPPPPGSVTKSPIPPSSGVNGPLDPQAAAVPAATVADVDPLLASQIPTPDSAPAGTPPSPSFAAALSNSSNVANQPSAASAFNPAPAGPAGAIDWSSSFHGLSTTPFSPETAAQLMQPIDPLDIEIKPDGIIYLPEIKYRRILNKAFGPGGWGLAPRGELVVGEKVVTREYALVVHGRFIAQARGECQYFSEETIPTAGEGCKSNALLRCCKDLGIASELWDPRFIREFKKQHCQEVWVEHVATKKRRQIWIRKDTEPAYPYQLVKGTGAAR
ncbi:hypothetical protein VTJ04DRAFT_6865 [Mycothermus thermophilus]|uniref:uncharacterized protein n=1 Tax=Humicola insolens TaxID=85995 RepID=UPI0037432BD4